VIASTVGSDSAWGASQRWAALSSYNFWEVASHLHPVTTPQVPGAGCRPTSSRITPNAPSPHGDRSSASLTKSPVRRSCKSLTGRKPASRVGEIVVRDAAPLRAKRSSHYSQKCPAPGIFANSAIGTQGSTWWFGPKERGCGCEKVIAIFAQLFGLRHFCDHGKRPVMCNPRRNVGTNQARK
jgi:hypothetical protein